MHHRPCLLLIRHAQSQNNALEESLRVPDPNITPLGVTQANKLAIAMKPLAPTRLYCSPFLRSLETARPISHAIGLPAVVRQDLYEQGGCHSGYEPGKRFAQPGMCRIQLGERFANWELDPRIDHRGWYELDHYETEAEARDRAQRVKMWFESEIQLHSANDRVAMVIHADFKLRLLEAFLEIARAEDLFGDVANTAVTRISRHGPRWRLDYWNVVSHLDHEEITF
jgi:2,3-bisphosphoglycerate-dependent phosphoglycerate mutase